MLFLPTDPKYTLKKQILIAKCSKMGLGTILSPIDPHSRKYSHAWEPSNYSLCSLTKNSTNLCTSSKQAPQTVDAPVCSCTSSNVLAPASTASLIIPFVIFMQWHTTLSKFILTPSFLENSMCLIIGKYAHKKLGTMLNIIEYAKKRPSSSNLKAFMIFIILILWCVVYHRSCIVHLQKCVSILNSPEQNIINRFYTK